MQSDDEKVSRLLEERIAELEKEREEDWEKEEWEAQFNKKIKKTKKGGGVMILNKIFECNEFFNKYVEACKEIGNELAEAISRALKCDVEFELDKDVQQWIFFVYHKKWADRMKKEMFAKKKYALEAIIYKVFPELKDMEFWITSEAILLEKEAERVLKALTKLRLKNQK